MTETCFIINPMSKVLSPLVYIQDFNRFLGKVPYGVGEILVFPSSVLENQAEDAVLSLSRANRPLH